MHDIFEIPIKFKGKEFTYTAEVFRYGYVHRIQVDVEGQIIFLENDEEGNYRAIIDGVNNKAIDKELIQAIVTSIETILK